MPFEVNLSGVRAAARVLRRTVSVDLPLRSHRK
jgi:hypothetical protein